MKHWICLPVAALIALSPGPVAAAAQSAPVRDCSPEDIRQALAGDYAGPPCRFTEMPDEALPQLAGARPAERARQPRVQPEPRRMSYRPAPPAARLAARPAVETIRLSDDFFQGGLVGGVGRAPVIQYGYRGMIVIDGSGRTGVLLPGQLSPGPVVSMDARARLRTRLVGP